jgi:DNA recombination protein RmuC
MNEWIIAGVAIGFLAGAVFAWSLVSGRLRKAQYRAVSAEADGEALRRERDADRQEIASLREKLETEQRARAVAETSLETERKNLQEQQRLLGEAQAKLTETFKALSGDVLAAQSQSFLQLAQQRFGTLRAEAEGDLAARHKAIEALVGPLGESLKAYGELIREMEKSRQMAYGGLETELKSLMAANESLQREAGQLAAALKGGSQVRGRWGEMTLRRVVELAGMSEHCDFAEQQTVQDDNSRLRPDLIVSLPGGRRIAVDAKAPLQPFLEAMRASTEAERRQALAGYGRAVRAFMNQLGGKAYWDQLQPAPDLVVLFLPGDSFFSAALEQDGTLIEDSMQKRVVIATPTTLIALLHAVAYGWRQEHFAEDAQEISSRSRELYQRLGAFLERFAEVGEGLRRAVEQYNRATGSLESRVLPSARRLQELGAASSDSLPEVEPVDEVPRTLGALQADELRVSGEWEAGSK